MYISALKILPSKLIRYLLLISSCPYQKEFLIVYARKIKYKIILSVEVSRLKNLSKLKIRYSERLAVRLQSIIVDYRMNNTIPKD